MLVVLLSLVLALSLLGGWLTQRHIKAAAWDRELKAAFGWSDREIPRHRVL